MLSLGKAWGAVRHHFVHPSQSEVHVRLLPCARSISVGFGSRLRIPLTVMPLAVLFKSSELESNPKESTVDLWKGLVPRMPFCEVYQPPSHPNPNHVAEASVTNFIVDVQEPLLIERCLLVHSDIGKVSSMEHALSLSTLPVS